MYTVFWSSPAAFVYINDNKKKEEVPQSVVYGGEERYSDGGCTQEAIVSCTQEAIVSKYLSCINTLLLVRLHNRYYNSYEGAIQDTYTEHAVSDGTAAMQ